VDSNLVSEEVMESVLNKYNEKETHATSASDLTMSKVTRVIDAFKEVPRMVYHADRKQFLLYVSGHLLVVCVCSKRWLCPSSNTPSHSIAFANQRVCVRSDAWLLYS
jgi:hypothetical protein